MTIPSGTTDPVRLGEPRVCAECHTLMRTGTLSVMLPTGQERHAVTATCRRRARALAARFPVPAALPAASPSPAAVVPPPAPDRTATAGTEKPQ